MDSYPWYQSVENISPINQGDIIYDCPILIPPQTMSYYDSIKFIEYDVIVISQSCDLENNKLNIIQVCQLSPLTKFQEKSDYYKSKIGLSALLKGYLPGYHLLNKCEIHDHIHDCLVVDFHNTFGVDFDFLVKFTINNGNRIRLLPPYREHLSQAFARFFMRVGLPVDISNCK
jgi:hypothetical protein